MKVLILAAHGSRRERGNEEIRSLAARLATELEGRFDRVTHAFLEFAEPTVPTAVEEAVAAGAGEILVIPYFLAAGAHVDEDIPEIMDSCRRSHPQVRIGVAPHLGAHVNMVRLLADMATEAG